MSCSPPFRKPAPKMRPPSSPIPEEESSPKRIKLTSASLDGLPSVKLPESPVEEPKLSAELLAEINASDVKALIIEVMEEVDPDEAFEMCIALGIPDVEPSAKLPSGLLAFVLDLVLAYAKWDNDGNVDLEVLEPLLGTCTCLDEQETEIDMSEAVDRGYAFVELTLIPKVAEKYGPSDAADLKLLVGSALMLASQEEVDPVLNQILDHIKA